MKPFEIRSYTLKTPEAAAAYRQIWIKHIASLAAFGVVTHGVFTVPGDATKVVALVAYAEGADPKAVTEAYMTSGLFKADMEGFDFSTFVSVDATPLLPTVFSPLQ